MDFQPPDPADLDDVHSLNRAFLDYVTHADRPVAALDQLSEGLAESFLQLTPDGSQRLARSPFLIFSLAEHEHKRWHRLFEGRAHEDLISVLDKPNDAEARLVSAALGFLWQLAKRRPYAARVVSGASLGWCERLAESTLVDLFYHAATESGLLSFRMPDNVGFWRRLLAAGTSEEKPVRRAARLSALQSMLTKSHDDHYRRLPAAACSMPMLAQSVADQTSVSKSKARGYNTPSDESTVNKKPDEDVRER
ncbi:MAG: hypothetical protein OER97_00910 [Gammaproteobacteria bacterium]|nr:hypothetical protein [Gammaproteobacteria bacterium]